MKFVHTLAAARDVETTTWAVADGLVQDFKEAGVNPPTPLHFKEAAEALEAFDYEPATLQEYFRAASVFGKSRRKSSVPLNVYTKLISPLWQRLDQETRHNDLVGLASQFFAEHPNSPRRAGQRAGENAWSTRAATAWAQAQAAGLDAERKAREEANAKAQAERRLAAEEAAMTEAVEAGDMERARKILLAVNSLRARLNMDLLKLDEEAAAVEPDPKATQAQQEEEAEEAKANRLHTEAKAEIEYALARVAKAISYLGNTYLRVGLGLTADDLDAYHAEIELEQGRLDLIQAKFGGTATDDALAAALAQWEADSTSDDDGGR